MVVKMIGHKGALLAHDNHVPVLAATVHDRVPCPLAHEDHARDDLVILEVLECLGIGERAADGHIHGHDVRYDDVFFMYRDSWLFRVLIR